MALPHSALLLDIIRHIKWRLPLLIALMLLVGVGEGLSVTLLMPLFGKIMPSGGIVAGTLTDFLSRIGVHSTATLLSILIGMALLQLGLYVLQAKWIAVLSRSYQARTQLMLYSACMNAKYSFIVSRKSADFVSAIITEADRLGTAFTTLLNLIGTTLIAGCYLALSFLISWQVTSALLLFAGIGTTCTIPLYRFTYRAGSRLGPLDASLQADITESFDNFSVVKANCLEPWAIDRIKPTLRNLEAIHGLVYFLPTAIRGLLEFLGLVGIALVIVVNAESRTANMVVILALFARLFPRLTAMQAQLHYLNGYIHSIRNISDLQQQASAAQEY